MAENFPDKILKLKISGIIQSGMLQEFDRTRRILEDAGYQVHNFFANEKCLWIDEERRSLYPAGVEISFPKKTIKDLVAVLNTGENWTDFNVQGWNIAELFFFIGSIKENTRKVAIVFMCFTTDLGEEWDLPEAGGFIFSFKLMNEEKIEFMTPNL